MDATVLKLRLDKILEVLPQLKDAQQGGRKAYLESKVIQAATERYVQAAEQAVIDISTHIIARRHWGAPSSYSESVEILARNRVIGSELASSLKNLIKLRNILVHAYLEVDSELLYSNLDVMVAALEAFVERVKQYIKRVHAD